MKQYWAVDNVKNHIPLTKITEHHLLQHYPCEDGNPMGKVLLRTEHLHAQWAVFVLTEKHLKDTIGQYGNRFPVGEPCVCSTLEGHAHSLWRGGSAGKQDRLSAVTRGAHRRLSCLRERMVLSRFLKLKIACPWWLLGKWKLYAIWRVCLLCSFLISTPSISHNL